MKMTRRGVQIVEVHVRPDVAGYLAMHTGIAARISDLSSPPLARRGHRRVLTSPGPEACAYQTFVFPQAAIARWARSPWNIGAASRVCGRRG